MGVLVISGVFDISFTFVEPIIGHDAISINRCKQIDNKHLTAILTINARSLNSTINLIRLLVKDINQPHIIMVSETWDPHNMNKSILNYRPAFIKTRKNRYGGGVAIYIHKDSKLASPHIQCH